MAPPPPFDPVFDNTTGEAIVFSTFLWGHIVILILLIIIMLYCYKRINSMLPITIVYLCSLVIGMESLIHLHEPLSPMIEIFFLLFQTSIYVVASVERYEFKKGKR